MIENLYGVFISIVAVTIVFIFAVEKFSRQVGWLVGEKFKQHIEKATQTPLRGVVVGTIFTSILQSSTAVSVLLVSMASAGIIGTANSLSVVIGANIGTTITTQLVAFKILNIAPYILIAGFILMKIKNPIQRYGKTIFYFGLIFSCLYVISFITGTLKDSPVVISLLSHTNNIFIAMFFGFVVCTILQSSSMATGILVILAAQGVLDINQALGLLFGINIGTTTTTLIAATGTNNIGKRVAAGHLVFNVVGVFLFTPFVSWFAYIVSQLSESVALQVAYAHTIFNVITGIIFLIFFKQYEKLIIRLVR